MKKEIKITPDLCEVIGAFMGDGCIYHSKNCHYMIQFSGDSRYDVDCYTDIICPVIEETFKSRFYLKKVKNSNAIRVEFYSKILYLFFKKVLGIEFETKTHSVKIPFAILDQERLLHPMIRGLFDTDGGVFFDKRGIYSSFYPRIYFHTTSKKLHFQLKRYLSKHFNIYTRKRKYSNPNHFDSYVIEIYGQKQLNKWIQLIGFSNTRHLSKIAHVA